MYTGFYLGFTSKQNCSSTEKKQIILKHKCDATNKEKVEYMFRPLSSSKCTDVFEYKGHEACMDYDATFIKGYL